MMITSKFTQAQFEEIYNFGLGNSVNSNESVHNLKRITKRLFLEQFSNIKDPSLIGKRFS